MKTIRYIAALLMLISGIWHTIGYFMAPADWGILSLVVGILYVIIGLLLFTPKIIGVYLGLIPIIPPIAAFFVPDVKLDFATSTLLLIDLIVFICCVYLLLKRTKAKT